MSKQKIEEIEITVRTLNKLRFNSDGLIPVIAQDYKTNEVLMLAYMNLESLKATIKDGRACYWSRSRQEYWVKGLTSGHFQYVKSISYDCDCDAILLKVDQIGAACHTYKRSCFYRTIALPKKAAAKKTAKKK